MEQEKQAIINKILEVRKENTKLNEQTSTLEVRKAQLLEISKHLQSVIADKAAKELESLSNERIYISQKSILEEENLRSEFENRLNELNTEKVELERRLEAESEFVSRTLRERLINIHQKTHQLRAQLNQKSREVTNSLLHMTSDEALKSVIQANQDACLEISNRIAESHREIEGLTAKAERLKSILEHLQSKLTETKQTTLLNQPTFADHRRKSYTKPIDFNNEV